MFSQVWFQTDKAAYLLRQYSYSNLHDRLSTRPFLSQIEKKWLAFQVHPSFFFVAAVGWSLVVTNVKESIMLGTSIGSCTAFLLSVALN